MFFQKSISLLCLLALGACTLKDGSLPEPSSSSKASPAEQGVNVVTVADAIPKMEPLSATGNKPYRVFGQEYRPLNPSVPYSAEGVASWYGSAFHGRRTASGEAYNMYAMSGAHRTLPLPSYLRVTNLENQRSVVIRLNDRGPFVEPQRRIVDLSYAAATGLGIVKTGTARVRIEAVEPENLSRAEKQARQQPAPEPAQAIPADQDNASYLQLGTFPNRHEAEQLLQRTSGIGVSATIVYEESVYHVKSGPYVDADQALRHKLDIDRMLEIEARVVFE